MTIREEQQLIAGCKRNDAASQKALFAEMYDYGMSVAARYGNCLQDTEEIANDAFYKIFTKINTYKESVPFKLWARKIIINTGVDFYRKNKKNQIEQFQQYEEKAYNSGGANLDREYLMSLLNYLTPQYKMVFILHVIEGYSHEEIAKELNITRGTSKSNLSKARSNLKKLLAKSEVNEYNR